MRPLAQMHVDKTVGNSDAFSQVLAMLPRHVTKPDALIIDRALTIRSCYVPNLSGAELGTAEISRRRIFSASRRY
jgi:hypothetical protein